MAGKSSNMPSFTAAGSAVISVRSPELRFAESFRAALNIGERFLLP